MPSLGLSTEEASRLARAARSLGGRVKVAERGKDHFPLSEAPISTFHSPSKVKKWKEQEISFAVRRRRRAQARRFNRHTLTPLRTPYVIAGDPVHRRRSPRREKKGKGKAAHMSRLEKLVDLATIRSLMGYKGCACTYAPGRDSALLLSPCREHVNVMR